jgi:hypothetical protein
MCRGRPRANAHEHHYRDADHAKQSAHRFHPAPTEELLLNQLQPVQAGVAFLADDNVVVHADAERLRHPILSGEPYALEELLEGFKVSRTGRPATVSGLLIDLGGHLDRGL